MDELEGEVPAPGPPAVPEIDPERFLLDGRRDPTALLAVWTLRRLAWPVLGLGVAIAAAVGQTNEITGVQDQGVDGLVQDLRSPLAGIVVALGLRLLAALAGYALAYRLTTSTRHDGTTALSRSWRTANDRYHLTRAFQSVRWTRVVRLAAAERLGTVGHRFQQADAAIGIAGWVALAVAVLALLRWS